LRNLTLETIRPHFSIIIPTFNRADLILSTVESILNQKNIAFEIIIVDDGSHDNTHELIGHLRDERVKYIKTENRERGAARNSGLQLSTGLYVNYFDSDDILTDCLFNLHQFISNNNFPNVVFGQIENVSENGKIIEIVRPASTSFKESLLINNFLACGSVFIKREIALNYWFSEDRKLSGTEDWELWLRLYSRHEFVQFPSVVFKQRQHTLRSLHGVPASYVASRETAFIEHINRQRDFLSKRFTQGELDKLVADRYTLIALSQCESGSKKQAFIYNLNALKSSLLVVKRKRFWAVLRKLILF
jgi:glycosyltransferase involved in cell wall biosynthesis